MTPCRVETNALSATALRPPFAYFGGKQKIAGDIAALLASHRHYVEPYAGGLSVLLAKKPSRLETVNDLDGDIVHFWRMLRNRPEELARACALTPHSRAERSNALDRPSDLDDIERARRIWVCLAQGRTGTLRRTGWRFDAADSAHTSMPRRLDSYIRRMEAATARLRSVSLECRPALDVIAAYGKGRRTLMYVDPPYLGEVRERNYRREMLSEDGHRELASTLHECVATVVLSGYASRLYDEVLFRDWYRVELAAATSQEDRTRSALKFCGPIAPCVGLAPRSSFAVKVPRVTKRPPTTPYVTKRAARSALERFGRPRRVDGASTARQHAGSVHTDAPQSAENRASAHVVPATDDGVHEREQQQPVCYSHSGFS